MHNRIKQVRKESGLSQLEFAQRLGFSTNGAIANIELQRTEPKDSLIKLICKEFNISEDWLRTGVGDPHAPADDFESACAELGITDPKAKAAILKYRTWSPETKEIFWDFVEKFIHPD